MNFRQNSIDARPTIEEYQRIHSEQVMIAYGQVLGSALALLFGAVMIFLLFRDTPIANIVSVWFAAVVVTLVYRLWILKIYKNDMMKYPIDFWEKRFRITMYASAVVWGSISFFIFEFQSILHQFFLIFMIAGIAAIASGTLASLPRVAIIFLLILLLPLLLVMLFQEGYHFQMMATLVAAFFLLLVGATKRINTNIMQTLHSKILYEKATDALVVSNEYFEAIFKEAPVGIFYYDKERIIIDSNTEMINILRISRPQILGLDLKLLPDSALNEAFLASIHGEKGYYEGPYKTMIAKLDLWITLKTTPMYNSKKELIGGIAIVEDISERVHIQEAMKHQAYYDALTNIPNRTLLKDRIKQALAHYRRHQDISAILFLDLDHFKSVNDSMGHHIGDALLIEMAKRLMVVCREGDTVARLGGDEFVILINELGNDAHSAASSAEGVAEKIHEILSHPFDIGMSEPVVTTSSIGIALIGSIEQSADDLLKFADTAMYQAKKEGRNTTRFYQEQMDQWVKKRLSMENALRNALKNNELELYYQPVIAIETKKIIGAEALLRWNHPHLGMVMPDEMISIAEESGLIVPIGDWVMQEAFKQFVQWKNTHSKSADLIRIAINVSAIQFRQKDFVDKVVTAIAMSGINPINVEIELTESLIIDQVNTVVETMIQLRNIGIKISMDDFGTGYSSLAYLKQLPFTTLKIDRSFVRDIMSDSDDAALVETILSIARIFNLDVIAEGVETVEQFAFLKSHDCKYFQGYLCSKPVNVMVFEDLMDRDIQECHIGL